LKFGLYRRERGELIEIMRGLAEGLAGSARLKAWSAEGATLFSENWTAAPGAPDHAGALNRILVGVARQGERAEISLAVHRIVHGGGRAAPAVLSPDVEAELQALESLAPLHQPVGLA